MTRDGADVAVINFRWFTAFLDNRRLKGASQFVIRDPPGFFKKKKKILPRLESPVLLESHLNNVFIIGQSE